MFDMKACGGRIKTLRREKNITQESLAEALNVSAYHFRMIEGGNDGASLDLLIDIAEYFDVSLDYLILGRKDMQAALKEELTRITDELQGVISRI